MESLFGEFERFGSEVIYPNRWFFLAATLAVAVLLVAVSYRRRWHVSLWQHRRLSAAVALPLLLVAILAGWYALSPLWERSFLEEAAPDFDRVALGGSGAISPTPASLQAVSAGATPSPSTEDPASQSTQATSPVVDADSAGTPPPSQPRPVSVGDWEGADDFHFARGQALLIETSHGTYILRVENFSVRNGPDLYVYLSPGESGNAEGAINLGGLKATDGAFNYDVPPGTDIEQFKNVIVWCRQFSVLFGSAPLVPVSAP